jgi:hypothetical protein
MTYYGAQFRMARAALEIAMRDVCSGARVSMTTMVRLEAAGAIEYGVRQKDRFEEATIAKVVQFFEERGVTFLPGTAQGAGIRYRPPSK